MVGNRVVKLLEISAVVLEIDQPKEIENAGLYRGKKQA
jgi:hypothetical protein